MQEYVIELSKYFIALFMVLYTGSCFYTFRYPVGEYSKGIFILQNILMFLVQVLCFLDLLPAEIFSIYFSLHLY